MRTNRDIYRKVLYLAVPMMIQNGVTNAVSLVDNMMVGSLGTECMTGVAIVGQLIFVFNISCFGAISGPAIYGAQYFGQGNMEGVKNIFRLKLWLCSICLVCAIGLLYFKSDFLIGLYLHGTAEGIDAGLTLTRAKEYLNIMLIGLIPFTITQIYSGTLRETGESVKPMVGGLTSVVVDVVFNYILIYGKLGMPAMGVRGAATATVMARFIEMSVVIAWSHMEKNKHVFLDHIYDTILVHEENLKTILIKSMPLFANELLWASGMAAMSQCYSTRGLVVVAGLNISNALCNTLNVVWLNMGSAVGIIVGQMLGASKFEEAKQDSKSLMWFSGFVSVGLTIILCGLAFVFPNFYRTTAEVRLYGRNFIIITALFFPLEAFLNALYFTIRSGGKTIVTFLFDSVYSWVVMIPIAFTLCRFTNLSILICYALVQSLSFLKVIVGYVLVQKGVWITNLVAEQESQEASLKL
ncbi:MAG: MATE family efflux transporter [Dorea sp.]|nr:MATE family efflux transporter [Dorea sp.]